MYPKIKELREEYCLTQKQVATILNMSQATYSRYETGKSEIPVHTLIKLAQLYTSNINYLVNLTNLKIPYISN